MGYHKPHDTRHTCATMMELAQIELSHRKKILGHKSNDITLDLYTHQVIKILCDDINKIHAQIDNLEIEKTTKQ